MADVFLTLTSSIDGAEILVNIRAICQIEPYEVPERSIIYFSRMEDDYVTVGESYWDIKKKIAEAGGIIA